METRIHPWQACLLAAAVASPLAAQQNAKVTQDLVQQWVTTEKRIAESTNDWALEKEIIKDSIAALKEEKAKLEQDIAEAKDSAGEAEKKRAELLEEKEKLQATSDAIAKNIATYEKQLLALAPRLPKPLQTAIKTPLGRIPQGEEAEKVSISIRTQNIVAILNEMDKFNNVVTKETAIQELEGGVTAEVTTLYFGLAGAYFSNPEGTYAGVGKPGPQGWVWTPTPDQSEQILKLLAVFDRRVQATYVDVPFTILD